MHVTNKYSLPPAHSFLEAPNPVVPPQISAMLSPAPCTLKGNQRADLINLFSSPCLKQLLFATVHLPWPHLLFVAPTNQSARSVLLKFINNDSKLFTTCMPYHKNGSVHLVQLLLKSPDTALCQEIPWYVAPHIHGADSCNSRSLPGG